MITRFLQSFVLAIENIRSNFFHTLLSVLGIVIGVGALVSILSLIDGMEKFAKDQISATTDLNFIIASTQTTKNVNGISVKKEAFTVFDTTDFVAIQPALSKPCKVYVFSRSTAEINLTGDSLKVASNVNAIVGLKPDSILAGRSIDNSLALRPTNVTVLTDALAKKMAGNMSVSELIGKSLVVGNRSLEIIGVISLKGSKGPELFYPIGLLSEAERLATPAQLIVEAESVTDVPVLKAEVEAYLKNKYSEQHDFRVISNEFRVEQAMKGIGLFRIIMGLIVGISVVVGGVGVMNVLLISVTERTAEIGIRKAMGANRKDIVMLFLSESIAVSVFGSFLGLVFGVLFTLAAIPIVKAITKVPFQADFTLQTFLVISILAILVGVVFGTYPALRASRLNPVDAIRHE